jgi:hypothetical protein
MGSDMSLYVDLRRKTDEGNFASCNQFVVSATGTVICYTDEKFEGKLIIRVGKAYYTTNTTNIVTVEMEQVNGLAAALAAKVAASGGEAGDTVVTFTDVIGTAENLTSGSTLKSLFGKIKNWFSRLGALAFKSKIANADVDSSAAIEYSKLSGVAASSHTHDDRYYTESEMDTKLSGKQNSLTFDDAPTASSNNPVKSGGVKTALDAKVTASGGEIGNTVVTFTDATGTRANLSSGDTTKSGFAKIKQWFAALGALAFKGSVSNSDVAANAAIEYSKLSGVAASSHTHGNITSDGKVGTAADKLLATGTGGAVNAKTVAELKSLFIDITHPVGSIYISATLDTAAKVATALGGTWQAWCAGRVPVGVDTSDVSFDTVEKTGGEKAHTLVLSETPVHNHYFYYPDSDVRGSFYQSGSGTPNRLVVSVGSSSGYTVDMDVVGGNGAHNNLQPYITCYMYKRTA